MLHQLFLISSTFTVFFVPATTSISREAVEGQGLNVMGALSDVTPPERTGVAPTDPRTYLRRLCSQKQIRSWTGPPSSPGSATSKDKCSKNGYSLNPTSNNVPVVLIRQSCPGPVVLISPPSPTCGSDWTGPADMTSLYLQTWTGL